MKTGQSTSIVDTMCVMWLLQQISLRLTVFHRIRPQLGVYLLMVLGSGMPASGIGRFVHRPATWFPHSLFDLQGRQQPTVHVRDMSPLFANDKIVGTSCTGDLALVVPGCRAPTPSKGKQRKRSIEVKSAVTHLSLVLCRCLYLRFVTTSYDAQRKILFGFANSFHYTRQDSELTTRGSSTAQTITP